MGAIDSWFEEEQKKKKKPSQVAASEQKAKTATPTQKPATSSAIDAWFAQAQQKKQVITKQQPIVKKPEVKPKESGNIFSGIADFGKGVVEAVPAGIEQGKAAVKNFAGMFVEAAAESRRNQQKELETDPVLKRLADKNPNARKKVAGDIKSYSETATKLKASAEVNMQKSGELIKQLPAVDDSAKFLGFTTNPRAIGRMVGMSTPQMLTSAGITTGVAVVTKNPALALSMGYGASLPFNVHEAYTDAKAFKVEDKKAQNIALTTGAVVSMVDVLPFGKLLSRSPAGEVVKRTFIQKVVKGLVNIGTQSALEAGTESVQTIIGNAMASTYDEHRDFFANVQDSALVGGILGAGVETVAGAPLDKFSIKKGDTLVKEALATPETERTPIQQEIAAAVAAINNDEILIPSMPQPEEEVTTQEGKKKSEASPELHTNATRLVEKAQANDAAFKASVDEVAKTLNMETKHGPVKKVERVVEKVLNDYNGDTTKVMDANRATIVIDNPAKYTQVIEGLRGKFAIVREKNNLISEKPGYKSAIVNVKMTDGSVAEVQLTTPEMLHAKHELGGHDLYKKIRAVAGNTAKKAQVDAWIAEMNTLYLAAEKAAASRLNSSSVISTPSSNALANGNGLPSELVATTSSPSTSNRTGTSLTSKNRGYVGDLPSVAIKPPFTSSIAQNGSDVNKQLKPGDYYLKRTPENAVKTDRLEPAKSPEELKKRIEQLNKFAQSQAILRRTGGITEKKAIGQFVQPGEVRLRGATIANDADYVEVLAHELGHAIEYTLLGSTNSDTFKVFGDVDADTLATIKKELSAVTEQIVGKTEMDASPEYYAKPAEQLARFFEKMMVAKGDIEAVAPTALAQLEVQSIKHPILREFLEAVEGEIDKGTSKLQFLPDLRQMYQKRLGKRVGNIVYDEELAHRAMQERGKYVIEKFVKKKFKGVKDDPTLLFRAAESIKITRGGEPVFGTRDYMLVKTIPEAEKAKAAGMEQVDTQVEDGIAYPLFGRTRYTEAEGKAIFEQLSPEGKQLIKDFTAARDEAKDYFNREIIKETNHIESNLEGWVHHYFDESSSTVKKGLSFKEKTAGTRKHREGAEGYVEDFQKAMTKALIDLEGEKIYNDFISRQFARVTKPIPEGGKPDAGWVEVVGDIQKGVGTAQEKRVVVIQNGKSFVPKPTRYQMPKEIQERYKLWKGLTEEANLATKVVGNLNRYWRVNILAHPGTAATNFIGGGIQYSAKVLTDFYTETLTGNISYKQTRKDVSAMLKILLPKGWGFSTVPDWAYGGDLSNYYGQYTKQEGLFSKSIDRYADKSLKLFSMYERYWKKVIAQSEGISNLKGLETVGKEGLRLPTKEERALLAEINSQIDLYAFDYDNVPLWLEAHQKSVVGQSIKPFAKYPYKYAKMITNMAGSIFDQSLPWQERTAKLLTLATIMGIYAAISAERKKKQQTPAETENTPARLATRGRLFLATDEQGKELFTRVGKYPFVNLTEAGMLFVTGKQEAAWGVIKDIVGSLSPTAELGLLAFDYRSKYDQYEKTEVIIGDALQTFVPLTRVLNDVSRMLDPFQRKQTGFFQTFTKLIPTTDTDLQKKLHGDIRTVRVPIEGDIQKPASDGTKRTTVDRELENYWQDILISMLSGVYQTRIDPKEAEAFIIREEKNAEEKANPKPKRTGSSLFRTKF